MTDNEEEWEASRGFLGQLLAEDTIPQLPYRGREQLLEEFHRAVYLDSTRTTESEYVLLTGVTQRVFTSQFWDQESTPLRNWSSYDPNLQLLLFRMPPSPAHEIASANFHTLIMTAITPMRLELALQALGSPGHYAPLGCKRPDQGWRPARPARGRTHRWPSMVLEVACSETKAKLATDVRYWKRAAPGDELKIILTIHINRPRPEITIEKHERNANNVGIPTQRVVVSKNCQNKARVSGTPLVIDFQKLFLRPPALPREKDLEIGADKLEWLANQVWEEQGF
ncbi:hypothetical protein BJX61DRAFT_549891 [Aspergillus egyptiacus]|nr:hypothetical protein BJX61DRAFT_549891 [Aspergillus egyptiacus]